MGMFTSVIHPDTGKEIQFKCGWDDCDTYRVGDTVDWYYAEDTPMCGKLLDNVYNGEGLTLRDTFTCYWIIIKDHKIHAVVDVEYMAGGEFKGGFAGQLAYLYHKYELKPPPLAVWSLAAWAKAAKDGERTRQLQREWDAEDYGLPLNTRAANAMHRYTLARLREDGILRKILSTDFV
jgi:hypothetical protein